MKKEKKKQTECNCDKDCTCGCQEGKDCTCTEENCSCDEECSCSEDCHCEEDCNCNEEEKCNQDCECAGDKGSEYLAMAQRIQADFDNFRRRAGEQIIKAREDGQISIIEAFLPCLDTFKTAKKNISDEKVLQGVEMIEDKILKTLSNLGVKKIETIGNTYNPKLHEAIAVVNVADKENDIIVEEYQSGYDYKGNIIRYSKVIVNKKED